MALYTTWLVTVLAVAAATEGPQEENGVLVLTTANFQDTLKGAEHILVEFYAPWCGHCQALAPEYEKAAKILKGKGSSIKLGKVDATVEKELGEEYGIQGYPTLKFFANGGEPMEYNGPRDGAGIVSWLEKKTGPPCAEVSSSAELKKLVEDSNVVIAAYFDDQKSANAKLFENLAVKDDRNKYVFIKGDEIKTEFNAKDSTVLLLKTFDETLNTFGGEFDKPSLELFVSKNSRPNMFEFNQETSDQIFGAGINKHFILLSSGEDKNHEEMIKTASGVGKEFKEQIIFVHMDTDVEDQQPIMEFLGVKKEEVPTFVIFTMEDSAKYHTTNKEISAENIRNFVQDHLDGKLKPTLKSAELPADWDSAPVKVLVSSNFKEVALDKSKDVFVEFYAPWCGHCKSLEPIWNQLAEKLKDRSDVVIAKMDATENELEEVKVQGFPTLKMFKKETNEIVDFNGDRSLESLLRFVETGEQKGDDGEAVEDEDDDYEDEVEDEDDDDEEEESEDEVIGSTKDEL